MNRSSFFSMVAEILESDQSEFTGEELLEAVGNWDSLSVISFVAMVDAEFNMTVDPEKLKNAKTLNDLAVLVEV